MTIQFLGGREMQDCMSGGVLTWGGAFLKGSGYPAL